MLTEVHFGEKIKALVDTKDGTVNQAAKRLKYSVQALYGIFDKADVNTLLLKKVAKAYEVELVQFFRADYQSDTQGGVTEDVRVNYQTVSKTSDEKKIAVLEAEKKGLEEQVKLLREMVDVLKGQSNAGTNSGTKE